MRDTLDSSYPETDYKKLNPTPDDFPKFVQRLVAMLSKRYDFGAEKLKATKAPMFFIHGDTDGVLLSHVAEMFRLKGGETHGDMGPHTASRLAILPDKTHVTLMQAHVGHRADGEGLSRRQPAAAQGLAPGARIAPPSKRASSSVDPAET